ncbi:MAG: DivIVA domain-containing protein [Gaiellales bacterium]
MQLAPVEVQHVKIGRRLLGYERSSVDQLLEDVTTSYETAWLERDRLREENEQLRLDLEARSQAGDLIAESLDRAHGSAEQATTEASRAAEHILTEATRTAEKTLGEVRAAADTIRREAQEESRAILGEAQRRAFDTVRSAEGERARLKAEVRRLEAIEGDLVARLRGVVGVATELLHGTDSGDEPPDGSDLIETRPRLDTDGVAGTSLQSSA